MTVINLCGFDYIAVDYEKSFEILIKEQVI